MKTRDYSYRFAFKTENNSKGSDPCSHPANTSLKSVFDRNKHQVAVKKIHYSLNKINKDRNKDPRNWIGLIEHYGASKYLS